MWEPSLITPVPGGGSVDAVGGGQRTTIASFPPPDDYDPCFKLIGSEISALLG